MKTAVAAALAFLFFAWSYQLGRDKEITEVDEGAWVLSSYYYHLAFERRDLGSPDWKRADCVDHPPIAKYLSGLFLSFGGRVVTSPGDKEWWAAHGFDPAERGRFFAELRARISLDALRLGRLMSSLCMAGAAVLLFLAASRAFGTVAAGVALGVFATMPLVTEHAVMVLSDPPFLLFLTGGLLAAVWWIAEPRFAPGRAAIAGVVAGLLIETKISGVLALVAGCTALALSRPARGVAAGAIFVGCALATAYLVNPSLYDEPIAFTLRMFEHRARTLAEQQIVYFGDVPPTAALRAAAIVRGGLLEQDWIFRWTWVPLLAFASILGLAAMPRALRERGVAARVVLVHAGFWGLATLATYRLDWPRYLLPAMPFVAILAGVGVASAAARASRLPSVAAAAAVAVLLVVYTRAVTLEAFEKEHPRWRVEMRVARAEHMAAKHPDDPRALAALARAYAQAGDAARAAEVQARLRALGASP